MRTPPPQPEHQDALSRRLALLGDELAWLRPDVQETASGSGRPGAAGERTLLPAPVAPEGLDDPALVSGSASPGRPWWDEHTRIAERHRLEATSVAAVPVPSGAPGRHAARRSPAAPTTAHATATDGGGASDDAASPPPWAATGSGGSRVRMLLGPAQLTVVALVVVLALGVTCWWLARGRPESTVALQAASAAELTPAPSSGSGEDDASVAHASDDAVSPTGPASGTSAIAASAPSAAATTSTSVTVDVSGKVRSPGIQTLPPGARIADALTAAGGVRSGVDVTALNLAQVLVDGQQILVGVSAGDGSSSVSGGVGTTGVAGTAAAGSPAAGTSAAASGPVQVVDLNTATADQLDALPDVGPVTAQSILSWRDAHGGFSSVDELLEVDGIGEVTLGKLAPYVTV